MLELYAPGDSLLHRTRAGIKLILLAVAGTVVFLIRDPLILSLVLGGAVAVYVLNGLGLSKAWAQIKPVAVILVLILLAQGYFNSWLIGAIVTLRFASLLLFAGLLTLTTKVSDMIAGLEYGLSFLAPLGVNQAKASLAIALALRFIPEMARITGEVREAQKLRGLERSLIALAIPVITRLLKMSDDIADAIDARGFDGR